MKLNLFLLSAALGLVASAAPSPSANAPLAQSHDASEAQIAAYLGNPAPVEDASKNEKREYVELTFVCQNAPWKQPCKSFFGATGQCYNVGDYNDKISSVGPSGGLHCYYYKDINCEPPLDRFGTGYPGINNLHTWNYGRFNDKISSFYCYWKQ